MLLSRIGYALTALAAIAALLLSIPAFFLLVTPDSDPPGQADALLVLGPPNDRIRYAEQIMTQGYAGTLVISNPASHVGDPAPCEAQRAYKIVCFDPEPATTRGEARALRRLAAEHGWDSVQVLTVPWHFSRARIVLERCYDGRLSLTPYEQSLPIFSLSRPARSWAYLFTYESAALIQAALTEDC